jgi:archaetidylinositol phosphate synthase
MVKLKKKKDRIKHKRIIQTLTAPIEKRFLRWMASKTSLLITPDILSATGLLAAILTAISYILSKGNPIFLWLACVGYIVNWFGDSMDGTLARYRQIERPRYGYFLDHSIDAVCVTMIMTGLGLSGYVRLEIALMATIGYLLLTLYTTLANFTSHEFQISFAYLGPTEIRLIGVIASIWVFYNGTRFIHLPFGDFTFFEVILIGLIVLFIAAYLISTVWQIIRLAKIEPPPGQ